MKRYIPGFPHLSKDVVCHEECILHGSGIRYDLPAARNRVQNEKVRYIIRLELFSNRALSNTTNGKGKMLSLIHI